MTLFRVRRSFAGAEIEDVGGAVREAVRGCTHGVQKGSSIAVAVGSRGIARLDEIVASLVAELRRAGARPFVVPAMGSHGGATDAGQVELLAGYGVTEDRIGAPIRSSMETVELPSNGLETRLYMDRLAHEADGVVLVNRVKLHTDFRGPHESGLMKMAVIGLGKHHQALAIHSFGIRGLRDLIVPAAKRILDSGKILFGLGIVENAYDRPLAIEAAPAAGIEDLDSRMLELSRANFPSLPVNRLHVLFVDEMGKDISGCGMDTNIIGRMYIRGEPEPDTPDIDCIVVSDLTEATHGNALGIGLADVTTRRLADKIDYSSTYENIITSTFLDRGKLPVVAESDREALEIAVRASHVSAAEARFIRIRNTLRLDELIVSAPLLTELEARPDIQILGPSGAMFSAAGAVRPFAGE